MDHLILSDIDRRLLSELEGHFVKEEYDAALKKILDRFLDEIDCQSIEGVHLLGTIAGFLIDIGDRIGCEDCLITGIALIEEDRDVFSKFLTAQSIAYNIGSGYSALYKLLRRQGVQFRPDNVDILIQSKNNLWQAYKRKDQDQAISFHAMLLVNLANALDNCGRIVEALHYYEMSLSISQLAEAHASKAQTLTSLGRMSHHMTANLLWQVSQHYTIAGTIPSTIPTAIRQEWIDKSDGIKTRLSLQGFNPEADSHETYAESIQHSHYRTFCIDERLTLCEHALYCNCIGARNDDLSITSEVIVAGPLVPAMEQVLNRIKSEFSIARLFYYQGRTDRSYTDTAWDLDQYDNLSVIDLSNNEIISTRIELLRASFRTCFSILDKIAMALCRYFDLGSNDNQISFSTFWKSGKGKHKDRWEKICGIDNISFLALYTQATDLNHENGEWGHFKVWRNKLEHDLLILTSIAHPTQEDLQAELSWNAPLYVEESRFEESVLQLLHFVRSAIFNFAFCIRIEGLKLIDNSHSGTVQVHTFDKKQC